MWWSWEAQTQRDAQPAESPLLFGLSTIPTTTPWDTAGASTWVSICLHLHRYLLWGSVLTRPSECSSTINYFSMCWCVVRDEVVRWITLLFSAKVLLWHIVKAVLKVRAYSVFCRSLFVFSRLLCVARTLWGILFCRALQQRQSLVFFALPGSSTEGYWHTCH